jgi:hypothetical protein
MPRIPPRKRKGSHNPAYDQDLLDLQKANPNITMKELERIVRKKYPYLRPRQCRSIERHLNRLKAQERVLLLLLNRRHDWPLPKAPPRLDQTWAFSNPTLLAATYLHHPGEQI